jgi:hypothetical protein
MHIWVTRCSWYGTDELIRVGSVSTAVNVLQTQPRLQSCTEPPRSPIPVVTGAKVFVYGTPFAVQVGGA